MIIVRLKRQSVGDKLSYAIVVTSNQFSPNSGKFLEKLGYYKPLVDLWSNKYLFIDFDRLKFWLAHGASVRINLFVLIRPILGYYYWQSIQTSLIKKIKN